MSSSYAVCIRNAPKVESVVPAVEKLLGVTFNDHDAASGNGFNAYLLDDRDLDAGFSFDVHGQDREDIARRIYDHFVRHTNYEIELSGDYCELIAERPAIKTAS